MTDLVSIIMPSWNTGKYISEAIQCVINQSYEKWELIIVDDNSNDSTDEIVRGFLEDKRIKYLKNKKNKGAALTRNYGLREAKGDWIAFLDSDDIWQFSKLEKQIAFMKKNKYVFSYHGYEKIDELGKPLGVYVTGPKYVNKRRIYNYDYIGHLTMMYNANFFGLIQIKDIPKNNDYAIRLKLFEKENAECWFLNENLARYRVRKNSISHDKLVKKLKSHYDLFRFCNEESALLAFWHSSWNLWYGVHKKYCFERKLNVN